MQEMKARLLVLEGPSQAQFAHLIEAAVQRRAWVGIAPLQAPECSQGRRSSGAQGQFPSHAAEQSSRPVGPVPARTTMHTLSRRYGGGRGQGDSPYAFDLHPITPQVTEYLRLRGVCSGCGHKHHAALPAGVPSGQLGPRALALVGTLSGQFHLTQGKIQRLLAQVMGLKFSIGTISMAHGHVAQALAEPVQQLQMHLSREPVRNIDETSHKNHNHMMWTWTQVCDWGAHFRLDPSRGQVAAKALLGEQPKGMS